MGMRRQLAVGIGGQVLLLTLVCAIALATLTSIGGDVERSSRAMVNELDSVREVRRRADHLVVSARGYLLTGDVAYERELAKHGHELTTMLGSLHAGQLFGGALAEVQDQLQRYEDAIATVVRDRERF